MKRLQAKAWAARWRDLDAIELAILLEGRDAKLNLTLGRGIARAFVQDLAATRDSNDGDHTFTLDAEGVVITMPRDHALQLRETLITMLELGLLGSRATYSSSNIRLSRESTVALVTPGRWV